MADLDALAGRFRAYYDLDPTVELTQRVSWLGIDNGEPPSVGAPGARTVLQQIHHADRTWVHPVLDLIDDDDWRGAAASRFSEKYLIPFRDAAERQRACTNIITVAVQAFHGTVVKARRDIVTIADHCILQLNGDAPTTAAESAFYDIVLDALGFVTGIGTVADVISLGKDIHSFFAAANGEQREPVQLMVLGGVDIPIDIVHSAWDALVALDQHVADQDAVMANGLAIDTDSAEALAHPGLVIPRPAVADGPETFSRLAIADPPDLPLGESRTVASIVQLYRAGYVNMPSAAFHYRQATAKLDQVSMPSWVHQFLPRAVPAFEDARLMLRSVFVRTAEDLADIGENMIDAATSYQLADDENAEALRQIAQIEPPSLDRQRHPAPGGYLPE